MILEGKPFKGKVLDSLKEFLKQMDLRYDEGIEYSVCILDDNYKIIGAGSVESNVIKCIAIDPAHQGQGLSNTIMSNLIQYLFEKGRSHIFIYTKPANLKMFADMGFYKIHATETVLLMENRAHGFSDFLKTLRGETPSKAFDSSMEIGAVVANCNPFTLGHRYLLEEALKQCDYLHLFILSDNRSSFPANERYRMVKMGIQGLDRIILHRSSDFMISAATFPTYFFKDRMQGELANCRLDLELFAQAIAPSLHITRRFVGTEPYCRITGAYNMEMKKLLPAYGISVTEITRKSREGIPVSASNVRKYIAERDMENIKECVPETVYEHLCKICNLR